MKTRTGFVGNSSSSSFLIVMDNNQLKKFEQCLVNHFITYEEKTVISNCNSLCDFLMVDGSVFQTFKSFHYDKNNNDIVFDQFSKAEWLEEIDHLLHDYKMALDKYSIRTGYLINIKSYCFI